MNAGQHSMASIHVVSCFEIIISKTRLAYFGMITTDHLINLEPKNIIMLIIL